MNMVQKLDIKVAELAPDMMLVCTHAEDWDPTYNVLWEFEANMSSVRPDVHCSECKGIVVLSNDAYGKYSALDTKPRICCTRCLPKIMDESQ